MAIPRPPAMPALACVVWNVLRLLLLRGFGPIVRISVVVFFFSLASAAPLPSNRASAAATAGKANPPDGREGVLPTAASNTIWFGGTRWDSVDQRWEAVRDSIWTFETGVGSSFDPDSPGRDPAKDPSFHSTMEGWIGYDAWTHGVERWRLVDAADPRWDPSPCLDGLTGTAAWVGLFAAEAESLCYAAGQGFGNDWATELAKRFWYPGSGDLTLEFDYAFDNGAIEVGFAWRDGSDPGRPISTATEFVHQSAYGDQGTFSQVFDADWFPSVADSMWVSFVFLSFSYGSDEDGVGPSDCGAVAVDNIRISGAWSDTTDFETGWGGWEQGGPGWWNGNGGELSHIVHMDDLPPISSNTQGFPCSVTDSVLVFARDSHPYHPLFQENLAFSPWIDLQDVNLSGGDALLALDFYQAVWGNGVAVIVGIELDRSPCPPIRDTFEIEPVYWNFDPSCSSPSWDYLNRFRFPIPVGTPAVRVVVGFQDYVWYRLQRNPSPWFDNIRLGVREATTPVTLLGFTAGWSNHAALLRWEVTEATNHAGFHVHRETPGSERQRLTDRLLAGQTEYEFFDESAPREGADYWLAEISRTGETTWHGPSTLPPFRGFTRLVLGPNYPNPFSVQTNLSFQLPSPGHVTLSIFDLAGREVARLLDGQLPAGEHESSWSGTDVLGRDLPAGIYLLRVETGEGTRSRRIVKIE